MNVLSGVGAPTREDLGGGFVAIRFENGAAGVEWAHHGDVPIATAMTTIGVDGRDETQVSAFVRRSGCGEPDGLRQLNQVHGATVVPAQSARAARPAGDGLWTRAPGDVLVIRSADCAVLWLVDPKQGVLVMAHAGWRGVLAGVVRAAIRAIENAGGEADRVTVAVGPHLGACCFEVGPDIAERFARYANAVAPGTRLRAPRRRDDSSALDLSAAIRDDLHGAGVGQGSISICPACTRCRGDLFHSYRRNGPGGPLMASFGSLKGGPKP